MASILLNLKIILSIILQVLSFFRTTTYNGENAFCVKMQRIPGISDLFKQTVKMALKSGRVIGNYSTPRTFMDEVLLIFGCFAL